MLWIPEQIAAEESKTIMQHMAWNEENCNSQNRTYNQLLQLLFQGKIKETLLSHKKQADQFKSSICYLDGYNFNGFTIMFEVQTNDGAYHLISYHCEDEEGIEELKEESSFASFNQETYNRKNALQEDASYHIFLNQDPTEKNLLYAQVVTNLFQPYKETVLKQTFDEAMGSGKDYITDLDLTKDIEGYGTTITIMFRTYKGAHNPPYYLLHVMYQITETEPLTICPVHVIKESVDSPFFEFD